MPTVENGYKYFSLQEVLLSIQKTILGRYTSAFWVKAEIMKINHYQYSGHAYPDLVEKSQGRITAQLRSLIWKDDYNRINKKFIETTNESLQDGINVMLYCRIQFDILYGLSLRIIDIDPVFSLGEMEKEKQETIKKIQEEELWEANKSLELAILPKRLAIISVETSKGYSDFMNILEQNKKNYTLSTFLFPSLLQGDKAVENIIMALDTIERVKHHFDAVCIIRGGGGDIGMACYNNYDLAKTIASFPLPVLTGIGHSTNETVSEMISYKNFITPTELAEFLILQFRNFDNNISNYKQLLFSLANKRIEKEYLQLENYQKILELMNPKNILKRGYSLTYQNDKLIKSVNDINTNLPLKTIFSDGEIISEISDKN